MLGPQLLDSVDSLAGWSGEPIAPRLIPIGGFASIHHSIYQRHTLILVIGVSQ